MKKLLALILLFAGLGHLQAQEDEDKEAHRERIKSLKTAFITQELDFSNKTAQKFWPIYNEYESKKRDLHHREHVELDNIECFDEEKAEDMLREYLEIEKEEYVIKRQLFNDLREILSARDIIKLQKLEDEFHKKLIKEYRARKEREEKRRREEG